MRRVISIRLVLGLFLFIALMAASASAATFIVGSTDDSHDLTPGDGICDDGTGVGVENCTFRAAIEESGATDGPDTILVPGHISPIDLSLGSLEIIDNATVITSIDSIVAVDALDNPTGVPTLIIFSDSNSVHGLFFKYARSHAVEIRGRHNSIGGIPPGEANAFAFNGLDDPSAAAVAIVGDSARFNSLSGNLIGTDSLGLADRANSNGILIDRQASDNLVEFNLISGNSGYGVVLDGGAHDNRFRRNRIGSGPAADVGPGNDLGGILMTGSCRENTIGGVRLEDFNLINLNDGPGITISGAHSNQILGNHIGLDSVGRVAAGNVGPGILLQGGSTGNIVGGNVDTERNLISSNDGSGVVIRDPGTTGNVVTGNYVGLDEQGLRARGNGDPLGHGVIIENGAHGNTIGPDNIISAHLFAGVLIDGPGSDNNRVLGNFVGISSLGGSSIANGAGVWIRNGASKNLIGGATVEDRNVISGNLADVFPLGCGVLIEGDGTTGNVVSGNFIGTDDAGTRAVPNLSAGVVIGDGAANNQIGGTTAGERNVISGNGSFSVSVSLGRGVHIFGDDTRENRVVGNFIGVDVGGDQRVLNRGAGIAVVSGARDNDLGGETPGAGNRIAENATYGILLDGSFTRGNVIRHNEIFGNDSTGILLRDNANSAIEPVEILSATTTEVRGLGAPPGSRVDIYLAAQEPFERGGSLAMVGSGVADLLGIFIISVSGLSTDDSVTAIVTDSVDNSSGFAHNVAVSPSTDITDDDQFQLPDDYELAQNYPNPFNPTTTIEFALPRVSDVRLEILDILGRVVWSHTGRWAAGRHRLTWDGRDNRGQSVASGVYIYRIASATFNDSRKMLLLK